jgi:hypothetical protein
MYGDETLEMKQVAHSKVPEDFLLPDLTSLTIDQWGNVFGVSKKQNIIVKFDADLEYLFHFSRAGKGPGEIQIESYSPGENRLSVDENGDVYFFDENPGRLVVFDNNGKYKKDIQLQRYYRDYFKTPFQVKAVTSNTFTALMWDAQRKENLIYFQLDPPEIKICYPLEEKRIHFSYKGFLVSGIRDVSYGPNFKVVADPEKIVFAESQRYRVIAYDIQGKKLFEIFEPGRTMGDFTDRELEKIGEGFSSLKQQSYAAYKKFLRCFADKRNVIGDVKVCEKGVVIFPVPGDITVENTFPVEIYDLKGNMVKKGNVKRIPLFFWKNYAYWLDRNEADDPIIIKASWGKE